MKQTAARPDPTLPLRWLPALFLLLLAPAGAPLAGETDLAALGAATLQPFRQDLQAALQAGLARSPEAAIDACRIEAPELAAQAGGPGLRVGRTSHRVRNPDNAPTDWQQPLLEAYLTDAGARTPRLVALGGGRYGYVEPIVTQPMCLACHGSELAPGVAERLAELYPEDRATGFAAGDLRGLFWVEIDGTTR